MKVAPRVVLIALNVALFGGAAAFWHLLAPPWQAPEPLPLDAATLAPQTIQRPPLDAAMAQAIAERPLFIPGRTAAAESTTAGKPGSFNDARLLGLLGSGDRAVAIISSGGITRRLRQGEQFDGWTLQGETGRIARFTRGEGETREVRMVHAVQPPPTATAPAAAADAAANGTRQQANAEPRAANTATPNAAPPPASAGTATTPSTPPNAARGEDASRAEELAAERRARREARQRTRQPIDRSPSE